jgi:putative membrane protein
MEHLLLKILVNAVSLAAAVKFIDGITFTGKWWMMLIIAIIFGFVNAIIKPVVKLFSLPLLILSLGLFALIINALMLELTAWLSAGFDLGLGVSGFWPAVKGALVISIVNMALSCVVSPFEKE